MNLFSSSLKKIYVHAAIGFIAVQSAAFFKVWGVMVIVYGLHQIVVKRNANNEAAFFAAYYTGLEVFLRMTEASLSHEIGKYIVIIFLLTGLLVESSQHKIPRHMILYLVFLLPAFTVIEFDTFGEARRRILFNFSGPISLFFSAIYFYNRPFNAAQVQSLFLYFVLPIFSMSVYLFFGTPSMSNITFVGESNFEASGGFGPNQVSSVLGCGIFLIAIMLLMDKSVTGNKVVDLLILLLLSIRGLLTFSRGGMLTAAIALSAGFVIILFRHSFIYNKNFLTIMLFLFAGFFAWFYINDVSGGALEARYTGTKMNTAFEETEDITSGRIEILEKELKAFIEYPILGLGIGMGNEYRAEFPGEAVAAHTEFTRLLGEHGIYGLFAVLILLLSPVFYFWQANRYTQVFVISFFVFSVLTMFHAAMRLALPGFTYGLSFLLLNIEKENIIRWK